MLGFSWRQWLNQNWGLRNRKNTPYGQRARFRPMLFELEGRITPSGTVTVSTTNDAVDGNTSSIAALIADPGADGKISLREAVDAANNTASTAASPNIINIPAGTYDLTAGTQLVLGSATNLGTIFNGTGTRATVIIHQTTADLEVIDAAPAGQVNTLTIQHVTISGGGFAGIVAGVSGTTAATISHLSIDDCIITGNTNTDTTFGQGGGIYNEGGDLTVTDSVISSNIASDPGTGQGGGIYYKLDNAGDDGHLSITGTTFSGNQAGFSDAGGNGAGGAIFVQAVNTTGNTFDISGNTFLDNQATDANGGAFGGALAVFSSDAAAVTANFNRFLGNTAAQGGTGVYDSVGSDAAINANDNWWGTNNGPAATDVGGSGVTDSNWLQLKLAASPATILVNQPSTLTASFLSDSAGTAIAAGNLGALIGLPITFISGTLGSLSAVQATIQSDGEATATFTAGATGGIDTATAQVDNAPAATTAITVQQPPQVTTQPVSQTTDVGLNASFTAHATIGFPVPTVQWFVQTDGTGNFNPIQGATTDTLTFAAAAADSGNVYHAVYSNGVNPPATTNNVTLTVNPDVAITTTSLLDWEQNIANYNQTVQTTGGTSPLTFSVSVGALPNGLNLDPSSGAITGTPNTAGSFPFTIKVVDAAGFVATQEYTVNIDASLAITTQMLSDWTRKLPNYNQTVQTSGGIGTLTFSISTGSLPDGLALDTSSGAITGKPVKLGSSTFTVEVEDSLSATATQQYTVTINKPPTIGTLTVRQWTQNLEGFSGVLPIVHGTAPYTIVGTPTHLPTGLTALVTGDMIGFTGTPTATGTFHGKLIVEDAAGAMVTKRFTITIHPPIVFKPTALPPLTDNKEYRATITTSGGTGKRIVSYTLSGPLPTGLTISPASPTSKAIIIKGIVKSTASVASGGVTIMLKAIDAVGAETDMTYVLQGPISAGTLVLEHEFPAPPPPSDGSTNEPLAGITFGADGNIWFTEYDGDTIDKLDPTTDAITQYPVQTSGSGPYDITPGPGGNLYFTEYDGNQIGMIDAATGAIKEYPVPTANSQPQGITESPDGNLWFCERQAGQIGEFNPTTQQFSEYAVPGTGPEPQQIAVGPDGNLWFSQWNDSAIGTFSATDPTAISTITLPAEAAPLCLTAGSDGRVWVAEEDTMSIGAVDPTTQQVQQYGVAGYPIGIAAGPDGDLYFTLDTAPSSSQMCQIGQINPVTGATSYLALPTLGCEPWEITAGPTNTLWFTEMATDKIGEAAVQGADRAATSRAIPFTATITVPNLESGTEGTVNLNDTVAVSSVALPKVHGRQQALVTTPKALPAGHAHVITVVSTDPIDSASPRLPTLWS